MQRLKCNTGARGGGHLPQTIKINPSEFPEGLSSEGIADVFLLSVAVFLLAEGENSGGKPVPAESGAPVSAVRTDDDDGDQCQVHGRNRNNIRLVSSQ